MDLRPEELGQLAPRARRRRDLPIDPFRFASEREPEHDPGGLGGLAQTVRAAHRDAALLGQNAGDFILIRCWGLAPLEHETVVNERDRIVEIFM